MSLQGKTSRYVLQFDESVSFVSFARLVRLCLGPTSVSARKLAHGNPLTILGIDLCIKHNCDDRT